MSSFVYVCLYVHLVRTKFEVSNINDAVVLMLLVVCWYSSNNHTQGSLLGLGKWSIQLKIRCCSQWLH